MYEFDSVSVSSYEASSLAAKLTEKSNDGWEVVSIVPAGSEITAYVRRASTASSTEPAAEAADTATYAASSASSWESTGSAEPAAASTPSEPAGWGTAPESSPTEGWGASTAATTPTAPAAPTTPSVPAGWYSDPAGRYELRYWDGTGWTEHVSRAGQQYTDPPVA